MRARKAEAVLESARHLFLERGFEATTVDDIAAAAQVSKATVYSNFPDKAAVHTALRDRGAVESAAILARLLAPLDEPGPVEDRVVGAAVALARGVLRPEVLQLRRLAVGESARFPDAVAAYFVQGPGESVRLLAGAFTAMADEGLLTVDDPDDAAAQFAYAVVGPLQDRAVFTGRAPDDSEVVRFATSSAQAFLTAHRRR